MPTDRPPVVAVLSVSAGHGHVRAAQAIAAAGERSWPHARFVHLDVMELVAGYFKKVYADGYVRLVDKHPRLWGYFYRRTDHEPIRDSTLNRFIRGVERFNARRLKTWLRRLDPDHVVCTHFLPAQFLARLIAKGTWSRPAWVAVTDFDCHGLWLREHCTGYFAASEEVAWRMRDRGIAPHRIHVTGIPIMPVFGERYDRRTCARELGLDPSRTTLLAMSGGFGLSSLADQAERLLRLEGDFQLIALAGRNERLLADLRRLAQRHPGRLLPLGFTTTIERAMACSDLAITKSGGLTTSECLAMGLPLIVIAPIPGQEERNADHLLENGAAMKAVDPATLAYRVDLLLREPERLAAMGRAAAALGRPAAAHAIVEHILGPPPAEADPERRPVPAAVAGGA